MKFPSCFFFPFRQLFPHKEMGHQFPNCISLQLKNSPILTLQIRFKKIGIQTTNRYLCKLLNMTKKTAIEGNVVSNEHKSLKLIPFPVHPDWIMHDAKYLKSTPGQKF